MSEHQSAPVHDGRHYLGSISEAKPSRFEAVLPNGKSIGLFSSSSAAVHAVIAAVRARARS